MYWQPKDIEYLSIISASLPASSCSSSPYLGQHLELLPPLVEVDESVGDLVGDGGVDHGEIGEEGAEVGDGAVTGEGVALHGKANLVGFRKTRDCLSRSIESKSCSWLLPDGSAALVVLLQHLLEVVILLPRRVRELGRALPEESGGRYLIDDTEHKMPGCSCLNPFY